LLVWQLPKCTDQDLIKFQTTKKAIHLSKAHPHYFDMTKTADKALSSFLRIVTEIKKSPTLNEYAAKVDKKMREKGVLGPNDPPFAVGLGFGLHVGWAIEGPIGSVHKIDNSYLSAHVSLSEGFESMTKTYGVPILFSGVFYSLLSPAAKKLCRRVDRLKFESLSRPQDVYCCDMVQTPDSDQGTMPSRSINTMSNLGLQALLRAEKGSGTGTRSPRGSVSVDLGGRRMSLNHLGVSEWKNLRKKYTFFEKGVTPGFLRLFERGSKAYVDGDWNTAVSILKQCKDQVPKDGPSNLLLKFMAKHNNKAPEDWPGHRPPPK
jgi:hypothetical protein